MELELTEDFKHETTIILQTIVEKNLSEANFELTVSGQYKNSRFYLLIYLLNDITLKVKLPSEMYVFQL